MNTALPQRWRCACGGCGCGCCEGIGLLTPASTFNRPGLASLHYRIGTHGSFLATMKARLSSHVLDETREGAANDAQEPRRPLALLRMRDGQDPAIALLDAWAMVADVLTFYQERIANEGYLRTATERRSLFELARLIGYQPRPGVASSVYLAYKIDLNTPQEIIVPRGARVQTVPAQDESPQSFETSQDLAARAAWNKLGLRMSQPQQWEEIEQGALLYLAGTQTRLKPGDALLIDKGEPNKAPAPYRVLSIDADPQADRTAVMIEEWGAAARTAGIQARLRRFDGQVTASETGPLSLADRIAKLVKPASKPPATALRLTRSLASSFEATGDTGLKVLSAVAPALKSTLAAAIAGFEAASPPQPLRVWALRLQAGLFGRRFPRRTATQLTMDDHDENVKLSKTVDLGEWPLAGITGGRDPKVVTTETASTLYLDSPHDGIASGSWIFVDAGDVTPHDNTLVGPVQRELVARVKTASATVSRSEYGATTDTTAISIVTPTGQAAKWMKIRTTDLDAVKKYLGNQAAVDLDFQLIRRTAVYAQSELLTLAERPILDDLCSGARESDAERTGEAENPPEPIELDGLYAGLEAGRFVIVTGERSDVGATRGVFASEPVMITSVLHDVRAGLAGDKNHTFFWIDKPLAYCYRRETVAILGNVVKATHGETRNETLGSGDGAKPLQRFDLKQAPLTHLPAPTAAGAQSTLRVYVNNVQWHEASGFLGQAPTDRIYCVQTDDQGKTSVQFGNGREGARLPTGFGNIEAVYRSGIGRPGNASANQITQLATRPLGVTEVTNPLRASGGADAESHEQVRRNAPLAVKSLDRLVSTPDYADFARTFAGIGKADAQEISDGRRNVLHLTIAGVDDIPIDADSDLMINLRRALRELGDPFLPLAVVARDLRLLIVSAKLRIHADHVWESVVAKVRGALLDAFGFEQRELAQGVASSEVLRVMQAVPGVVFVDLDVFGAIETTVVDGDATRPLTPVETAAAVAQVNAVGVASAVQARHARRHPDGKRVLAAQLALLSADVPETLVLNQMTGGET